MSGYKVYILYFFEIPKKEIPYVLFLVKKFSWAKFSTHTTSFLSCILLKLNIDYF